MTKGLNAKVEGKNTKKVAKKTAKRQTKTEADETKEEKEIYKFVNIDGEKIFLKPETVTHLESFGKRVKDVDNDLMLFELKKENINLKLENLNKDKQLLERESRDVDTAIFHKRTEKKNINVESAEYRQKIGRELGNVKSFGYHPETFEVKTD